MRLTLQNARPALSDLAQAPQTVEETSISTPPDATSLLKLFASLTPDEIAEVVANLDENALRAFPYLFEAWGLEHQRAPEGDWGTWLVMGGRGAGKTRAGAEWVREMVEGSTPEAPGQCKAVALVGETLDQAREVMVFGPSGIIACSPPDRRPKWEATRKRLVWPNGAVAQIFSAHDPETLRGPQFDAAWCDEIGKWSKGQECWDMLQFALRLGENPRVCATTTPRNSGLLKQLLDARDTVVTQAPTEANAHNLSPKFLERVEARYGGTALGRQELDGVMVEDAEGALWRRNTLKAAQAKGPVPELDRVVVAVDPPVTGHGGSDACGIIVAGVTIAERLSDWRGWVLQDATVQGVSPGAWSEAVAQAAQRWGADRVVAEVNQGGDLVEMMLRQASPGMPYKAVHASRGKAARAEPVAALYEQGRVIHARPFPELEDQMCAMLMQGYSGQGSPDRLDALVWALHELMVQPGAQAVPKLRAL